MKRLLSLCLVLSAWTAGAQTPNIFAPAAGSYGAATNWSLGHVPDSNDVAVISVTNNAAAMNSAGTFAAGALVMGASTRTGNLVVTGGQLSYGAASTIATNGSTANLINNGGLVLFSNALTLANSAGAATFGSVTNQAGTLRVEGNLQLGVHLAGGTAARGQLTVNGGTVTVTGNLATCNASAWSYINLNGGVLEIAALTHGGNASQRALNFNGGTLRALRDNGNFMPVNSGFTGNFTGQLQNAGGTIDVQGFTVGVAAQFINVPGSTGTLTKVGSGVLDLQGVHTYTGQTRVAEGTLKLSGGGSLYNGGTLGGLVRVEPGAALFLARHDALGNHASVSPVVLTVPTNALVVNSNTFTTLRNPVLRGGELRTLGGASATYGSYQLKGTVTVAGDSTSLFSAPAGGNGFSQVQLGNNAAGGQTIFDVADGAAAVDLQVDAALVDGRNAAGSATVPSGLIKSGAGVMVVTSNNTFTGTASVNAGTLRLGANATVAGELAVAAGAVLDVSAKPTLTLGAGQLLRGSGLVTGNVAVGATSQLRAGGVDVPGTLTVGGNLSLDSAYESVFDLTNSTAVGGGTNDLVRVTGDLDAGLGTIRINPLAPLVSGTYRLMEYTGTETLPFSGGLVGLNTRDTAVLDETTPGQVNLIVTAGAAQALAWNPAVDGNWDYGTQNWLDAGTRSVTEQFYDLDTVLFDDAGAFNNVVNVTTNLRPAAIYVTGGSNYTFVGNGRIQDQQGGATALGKDGPGELTLGTTNSFSGGIVVSNGLLVAGVSGALGGGPVTLLGGQLALAAPMTVTNTVALQAPTVVVDDRGNAVTLAALVSGTGQLVKSGGGTLTLGVANTYTGGTVISAGMVRQAVPGALGAAPGSIILGDAGSGTNAVAWRFAAATQPSNAITVTALGTGPASLGSYNNSTFTEHRGSIALARAVTLVDGTTDRTSFMGPITGAPGLITISGNRITLDNPSNTFVAGLLINGGSIYQNNSTSALPFTTTITNNGSFRLNNGGRHVVDALGGTGTVDIIAGGVSTLSLGNGNGSDVFAGRIVNGAAALSLEKKGVGVQTLSNTNSYTGNTTILGGTLALSGLATLAGTPQILVGASGTFDVSARPGYTLGSGQILYGGGVITGEVVTAAGAQVRPGGFNFASTLTFKNTLGLHAGTTNWFDLTGQTSVGGGTNDLVIVDGLLEPSNSVIQVNVLQPLTSGVYTLFTYTGTKTTTFNPAPILSLSPGRKTVTVDETVPGQVNLNVSGSYGDLVWLPQTNAAWDFVVNNWSNPASAALDTFFQSDAVTFDERGAYSNVVTLTTTTQPARVTVAGASNYVFQGAGGIGGIGGLVKSGAGTLVMANTNTYLGQTTISNGTLQVGNGGTAGQLAGTGVIRVESGATLVNFRSDLYTANLTLSRSVAGAGDWIVRGSGGSLTSDYLITGSQTGFTGTLTIDRARFQADTLTDAGYAAINVLTGGQFWAISAATYSNAITLQGAGWPEATLYGALRLQAGASYAGPITLTANARIGSINGTHYITSNISGPYDLEAYGGPASGNLMLAGQNTFNNLRVLSYWTYVRGPASVGTGDVVMAGGGFSSYADDLTLTNDLLATTTVYVGQDQAGVGVRSMTWAGNWNLGGALRQVLIYNTNTLLGAVTNGGMEVRQDGLLVFNGDIRLSDLYLNQSGVNGFVRQDGGTVVVANAGSTGFRIAHWSTTGAYTMNGGLLSNANGRISVAWDGTGTLSVNGGTVVTPQLVVNDNGTGGAGILNLNGGTVVIGGAGLTTVGGPATVNLNGGTLSASANWASALPLIANGTNGATIVNPAGYTVTLHGALSGTGAVQQAGGGMLILNGPYAAGPLTVTLGTLAGTGTVSAAATVAAGGTLQPGTPAAAGFLSISSVTFAAGAQFNPLLPGIGTLLRVTATNGLTLPAGGAVATVNVVNASLAVGTYPILDYAGAVQGGDVTNLVLGTLPPRTVMYLTNNTVNTSIDLVVVTAGEPIKWLGNVNGQWNIDAPTNWVTTLGGLPTAYLQAGAVGDALQFDDTAAGNFSITLQTNVSPASMLVSNDANDYAIGGGFGLGGAMALRKFGMARLTLETSNSFAGGILVAGGTLQLGNGGVGGALGAGPISNNASLVFVPGDTVSVAAVISGAGTLTKAGAGKLTLSADNTYTGATVVNRGVLELNTPNFNTYRGGVIAINSGATFRVAQSGGALRYDFPGKTFAFDGTGGGVMELGASLNFTFTGGGCTFTTAGGAENRLQGLSGVNMANNAIVFAVEPGTDTVALAVSAPMGNSSGGLNKLGAGLLSLSATNSFTGSTVLNGGTLRVEDSGKLYHGGYQPSAVVTVRSNAVLDLATWSYSEPGAESLGGLRANNNAIVVDGGTIRVRKNSNYYRGFTIGAAGATLEAAAGANWGLNYDAAAPLVSTLGGSLTLIGSGTGSLHKAMLGTGGLVKNGTGVWTVSGTNTYNGATAISNGTLLVNGVLPAGTVTLATNATLGGVGVVRGPVLQDGIIAPGAGIGKLTISNQVTDGATAVYRFELGGTNAPTDYDQLVVGDVHTLQGTLEVVVTNGYVPASGDRFVILTNSGLGGLLFGTFTTVSAPALASGLGWDVQYTGTESASLVVTGTVSGGLSAYEQWAQSIPNPAERGEQADPDGDGYANLLEYSQGTDATNSADNAKLSLLRTNGQFLVLFNRVNSATDIVYEVEGAYLPTNNALWLGIATNVIGSWGSSTNVNDNNTAAVHRVLVTDLMIGTNRSLRLKVTRP